MPYPSPHDTLTHRHSREVRATELAFAQEGVVSRRQLADLGVPRWLIRGHVLAGRWQAAGRHTVVLHNHELDRAGHYRRAVFETGGGAMLAGVSALLYAGLTGFEEDTIHVAVDRPARYHRPSGVTLHVSRRLRRGDVITVGLPRLQPAVAAVLGALWARSLRQGALIMVMAVNQRLTDPRDLADAWTRVRRHRWRVPLTGVVADLVDGVRSMGELDFAALCRRYGLPVPERQVVRRGPRGRVYLDVRWARWSLVVEIDGIGHLAPEAAIRDALRQNAVTLEDDRVLRIPVLGLRLAEAQFMAQVAEGLRRAGAPLHPALRPAV